MNEAKIKNDWNELVEQFQGQWKKLTEEDFKESANRPDVLIEKIAARYKLGKAEAKEKFYDFIDEISGDAETQLRALKKKVAHLTEIVGEKSKEMADKGKEVVQDHPVASVGVVLAIGALIGWLICRK